MLRKTGRAVVGILVTAVAVSLTACSGDTGIPQRTDWTSDPAYALLSAVPASTTTRYEIDLTSGTALNLLNAAQPTPLPTTGESGRPAPADFAWSNYSLTIPPCTGAGSYDVAWTVLLSGPLRSAVTVMTDGKPTQAGALSLCTGAVDASRLTGVGGSAPARSIEGVPGLTVEGGWLGYAQDQDRLIYAGPTVPESTMAALAGRRAVAGSLADDPQVRLVVAALGEADTAVIGTVLVRGSGGFGSAAESIAAAQRASGKTLPAAELAGLGWRRVDGLIGDALFVTVYPTAAAAQTAAQVLTTLWGMPDTKAAKDFPGARTTVTDRTVVTVVSGVDPHRYDLRAARALFYPGYQTAPL